MNLSIPDEVKIAFNDAFEGEDKSAIISGLMRRAIEERDRQAKRISLVEQMRAASGTQYRSDQSSSPRGAKLRLVIDASVAPGWILRGGADGKH